MSNSCPGISNNLSKKLLIQILKSKGRLDCSNEKATSVYFTKCENKIDCKESVKLYQNIKNKYSGNVIGGE